MTAVVEMSMEAGDTSPPTFTVKENVKIESVGEGERKIKNESESCPTDKDCDCEPDGAALGTQEVKVMHITHIRGTLKLHLFNTKLVSRNIFICIDRH